ncbi:M50 family metallopeptidase [Alteriqipengyuania sp. 357]
MSSYFAEQDRQKRVALLVILGLGSIMLWSTPFGALLLYPFTILTTWFHEMGHGIAAIFMGERFDHLVIYPDGSGVAVSEVSPGRNVVEDAIIAAGGPIGPALAGAALIASSRTLKGTQIALAALGAALILTTAIWVRSITGWAVLVPMGLAILLVARQAHADQQRFAIQLLGVQAIISVWAQSGYLFTEGGTLDGRPQVSDTGAIADALLLPYWFWGIALSALNVLLLWWSFRYAFGRARR